MTNRRLILSRHGESEFLKNNLFCGWVDSPLTEKGKLQSLEAGKLLKKAGLKIDECYTSFLSRAEESLNIILDYIEQSNIPIYKHWRLNERHYGALTGLNKKQTVEKYGTEQVQLWRRSYDVVPPPMESDHPYYNQIRKNPKFQEYDISLDVIPNAESLKTTVERILPYWNDNIVPSVKQGKTILVVCHGTVIRALIKHIESISDDEIRLVNIPTAIPLIYEFNDKFEIIRRRKYLADDETVKKALDSLKID